MAHVSCVYFIKQYRENQKEHGGSEAARVGARTKERAATGLDGDGDV